MTPKTATLVVLTILTVALFFILQKYTKDNFTPPEEEAAVVADNLRPDSARDPASDFVLPDLNGKNVRLTDYRGSVVLMLFWTTW